MWSVADHLEGTPEQSVAMFHRFVELTRPLASPRVRNARPYTARLFVHHLTLTSISDLDDELAGWVEEAYAVGAGAHLR